eukprot:SAG31_NODE_1481_length_8176_cov_3.282531_8_plen_72_part_00
MSQLHAFSTMYSYVRNHTHATYLRPRTVAGMGHGVHKYGIYHARYRDLEYVGSSFGSMFSAKQASKKIRVS